MTNQLITSLLADHSGHSAHALHFLLIVLPLLLIAANELVALSRQVVSRPTGQRPVAWRVVVTLMAVVAVIHFMPMAHTMAHHETLASEHACCMPKLAGLEPPISLPAIISVDQVSLIARPRLAVVWLTSISNKSPPA